MSTPRGSPWVVIGAFALVGPPVGGIVFGLMLMLDGGIGAASFRDIGSLLGAALMGYFFGMMPALLTGVVAAAISSRVRSKLLWVTIATLTGAAFSSPSWGGFEGGLAPRMAVIGGIAALASAIVGLYVRPRWTN